MWALSLEYIRASLEVPRWPSMSGHTSCSSAMGSPHDDGMLSLVPPTGGKRSRKGSGGAEQAVRQGTHRRRPETGKRRKNKTGKGTQNAHMEKGCSEGKKKIMKNQKGDSMPEEVARTFANLRAKVTDYITNYTHAA